MKFRNVISGPIFCADAPDVVIETADAAGIDVRLSISGFVWQFALSPVAEQSGYVATIKTRDILEALIEPSSIGSGGVSGVPVVEISAGADTESSISMSFQALYGSAAGKTPADMARHWLTWRDQITTTYFGCRERLTFFAGLDLLGWKSGSYTVAVKIYTPSGIVQATLASGTIPSQVSYISVDASPASVLAVGDVSSLLAYDLSFSLSGTAADDTAATVESYPLRLVLGAADPRAKEFIYINSLGVEDRVTACGIRKDGLEGGSSKFVNGGVEREHGNDAQEQFEVYSGHLATARSVEQWMEFLKSSERHLYNAGLKGIVIDEYDTEAPEGELSSVSFTYRLSERIRGFHHDDSESIGDYDPKQKYGALIVGDIPDATTPAAEDLFFLKTRLDEFPLVSLSEDYLLLVQSPVSYHWGAASLDSVKNWIQKTIDHNGISLAAVWASLSKTVPDTYANELISEDHIPVLPQSKVTGLSDALSSLRAGYTGISALIPQAATADNQLADKEFVNSSIATATATFRGTFATLAALEATPADRNDYAFWQHKDEDGNTCYDKYTYTGSEWKFEYRLNNSSFTAAQWGAINSGITGTLVTKLSGIAAGAQVNVIETVKLGGTALPVSGKAVDITGTGIKSALGISDWALAASKPSYTTAEVTEKTNLYFTDTRAVSALSGHTGDITIHITAAERKAWNAKWDWNEASIKAVKVNAAGEADKLANSRKLWGNAFNGEADVNGDITLGSGKRIYFGSTSYYIELVNGRLHTNVGLYSDKFISARGVDPDAGGGSGASLPVVWASLQGNTDDYKDKTIHQAHIPTLPVSRIVGLATALAGKQAVISDLNTIRTNAATAYGWGDHSEAGYITGITKAMVESVLTGNITSHTHTFNSLTSKPTTLAGYGITDASRIFRYMIPASGNKGVRITFTAQEPVKITVSGSNQHAQLVLVGTGYGEGGFIRNNFTELVHSDSGYSWCIPDEARSVEVFSTRTVADYVTVESPSPVTFTAISALSKTAVNRRLLNSLNYSSYALPLTGGTLNGWLLINASTLSIAELTADTSTLDTSWNRAQNINLLLRSGNNAMTISLGGQSNERKGIIQVGHAATTYANVLGDLYLNKFGGKVYIGEKLAYHEGNSNDLSTVWSAKRLVTPDNLICPYTWYNNNNITGTIVLSLPYSFNSMMQCIELTLYDYTTASGARGATKFIINGYNYYSATNSSWVNPMVFRIGNTNVNVRVGHYKNTCCILIGTTDSTWLYPRLCVDKLYGSFSNHADSFKNNDWSCTILQDESEITNIVNATDTPLYAPCYTRAGLPYVTDNDVAAKYLKLSGGTMAGDAAISWGVNDRTDWDTYVSGIRVMSSITANSGAPVQYATGISVMARYSFQIAAQGGDVDAFFIRAKNRDWKRLLHEGNYSSFALPLTGGTITGSIRMDGIAETPLLIRNYSRSDGSAGGWARSVIECRVDDKNAFRLVPFGSYVPGDANNKISYVSLGFAGYDGLNLRISETDIKWGNDAIYHTGNANKSDVDWACKSLTAAGDISTAGWCKATNGLSIGNTGVYFTHFGTVGEIDMVNNNEFIWGSKTKDLHFNYKSANNGAITVTNYIWHAGSSSTYATHTMGSLTVLGTTHATTGIYTDGYISARKQDTSSDIRLKTDFRPLDGALEYIRGTHFTRFRWKDGSGESVGIIAQEEQSREYGFLVKSHGEIGHLTYDYAASTALLGAALQEEDEKVEALKKRVKELENELNKLKQSNYAR